MAVTGGTVDMKTAVGFPFPQGCTVEGQTANFSVAVPEGQTCELIIYKKGARTSAFSQKMPYSDVAGNLHFLSVVLEQPEDYEYCYKIGGKIVPDPYGKAFSGIYQRGCFSSPGYVFKNRDEADHLKRGGTDPRRDRITTAYSWQ